MGRLALGVEFGDFFVGGLALAVVEDGDALERLTEDAWAEDRATVQIDPSAAAKSRSEGWGGRARQYWANRAAPLSIRSPFVFGPMR